MLDSKQQTKNYKKQEINASILQSQHLTCRFTKTLLATHLSKLD